MTGHFVRHPDYTRTLPKDRKWVTASGAMVWLSGRCLVRFLFRHRLTATPCTDAFGGWVKTFG